MTILGAVSPSIDDVWRFRAHPEVWLLVASLVGLYVYAIRVIGPKAVPKGVPIVTRKQLTWFVVAMVMLWGASDWPIHDIAERHLYSVHMFQHMVLSYFLPPAAWLATPTWLARLLVGKEGSRSHGVIGWLAKPVVAGVAFNAIVMVTHIPGVVNNSVRIGWLHYLLHLLVVLLALLVWLPICGPLPELRMRSDAGQMIYLFLLSIVPTVPAGWLTFADGVVYKSYNHPPRVFGLSPTYDQQLAGVVMKIGGSVFLWTLVAVIFFRRFARSWYEESRGAYVRPHLPDAEIVGNAETTLTFDQVAKAFDQAAPVTEPTR